jgi:SAM-dependent methyltransferase
MTNHTFISSPVSVLTGDAARVALASTNDAAHYTQGKGVLSVPLERWQAAQEYERATWLEHGLMLTEDRNAEHAAMFDGYKALPDDLGNVIELGCGPFTNWRFVREWRQADHLTLLDPMAYEYMNFHPHCLYAVDAPRDPHVKGVTWIQNESIEGFLSEDIHDTVVMINVLSHCQSVEVAFQWIADHLKTGGYLVFHEPARDINPLEVFDIGHPLSYTQDVIEGFLSGYTQVYRNGDYFIGLKK